MRHDPYPKLLHRNGSTPFGCFGQVQAEVIVLQEKVRNLARLLAQTKSQNRKNPNPANVETAAEKAFDAEQELLTVATTQHRTASSMANDANRDS